MTQDISLDWLTMAAVKPNEWARQEAMTRQVQLTKPPGALGQLEEVAIQLAALQGTQYPQIDRVHITVFVGDHGIAAEGVSAFPQTVTTQMVNNFASGGAAINVAAKAINAKLEVINLGTVNEANSSNVVKSYRLGAGTANFCIEPAMTQEQLANALSAGRDAVEQACACNADLFIGGEMGIGNTSSATALTCALLNEPPRKVVGPGTGLGGYGVNHKADLIEKSLSLHQAFLNKPLETLRRLGGFEIAALTGAYIACAQKGLPVLVDGFIAGSAALMAFRLCSGVKNWLLYSHTSAEPGHRLILNALNAKPLLNLGMRLGEGSGAAVAVPLLRMACAFHNDMATFSQAQVSEKR